MTKESKKTITTTLSSCPECFAKIEAVYHKDGDTLVMVKQCPEHGAFTINISSDANNYLELKDFLINLIPENYKKNRMLLYAADECNLNCPMCYFRHKMSFAANPTLEDIAALARENSGEINLCAREVSTRDDIVEVMETLKRNHKQVAMYSNGIKLADFNFLKKLYDAGLNRVELSFDGFDSNIYHDTRGGTVYEQKIAALENLKKLGIPTILMVTVMKGVNEHCLYEIIDYCAANQFVAGVMFLGYAVYGKRERPEVSLDPDYLMQVVKHQSNGKISIEGIIAFHKLLYIYLKLVNQGTCINFRDFWVFRMNNTYRPIYEIFDIGRLNKVTAAFLIHQKKRHKFSFIKLCWGLLQSIADWRFLGEIFLDAMRIVLAHAFARVYRGNVKNNLLRINFHSVCDPYRIDYKNVGYCATDFTYKKPDGSFFSQPLSLALMEIAKMSKKTAAVDASGEANE